MRHLREGWCEELAKARIADCNVPWGSGQEASTRLSGKEWATSNSIRVERVWSLVSSVEAVDSIPERGTAVSALCVEEYPDADRELR